MELEALTEKMRAYNGEVTPGGECAAWQDYVHDCYSVFGWMPWDIGQKTIQDDGSFARYWTKVAAGESGDYDADTGSRGW